MRGRSDGNASLFFTINVEDRISKNHPLRAIKSMVNDILAELDPIIAEAYPPLGRPSVPPERLLRAMLLMTLYSIRSERQLVQRLDTDLLFRWFCGMDPQEDVFDATAFTHNRKRMEDRGIIKAFFNAVVKRGIDKEMTSDEHFSVDGTMIESFASNKSFQPIETENPGNSEAEQPAKVEADHLVKAETDKLVKSKDIASKDDRNDHDGDNNQPQQKQQQDQAKQQPPSDSNRYKSRNPEVDFKGQKRRNETHRSKTDPEARLHRKSDCEAAKLSHMGHAIIENRNGLIMAVSVSEANGRAEWEESLRMLKDMKDRLGFYPKTLGADKGYDTGDFLLALEERGITPHVAMKPEKQGGTQESARRRREEIEKQNARKRGRKRQEDPEYTISQKMRKKVEECFGWMKTIGGLARAKYTGRWKINLQMLISAAMYNIIRISNIERCLQ